MLGGTRMTEPSSPSEAPPASVGRTSSRATRPRRRVEPEVGRPPSEPVVEDQQRGRVGPPGRRPQPDDHDRSGRPRPPAGAGRARRPGRPRRGRPGRAAGRGAAGAGGRRARAGRARRRPRSGPRVNSPADLLPLVGEHRVVGGRRPSRAPGLSDRIRSTVAGPGRPEAARRVVLQGGQGVDPAAGGQRQHPGRQRLVDGQGGHEPGHLRPVGRGRGQRLVHGEPLHQHQHPRRRHRVRRPRPGSPPPGAGPAPDRIDHDAHEQGQPQRILAS